MGIFKSKQEKEIEKKMLIRKTVSQMKKHIEKLEAQKKVYIEAAKRATKLGMTAQVNLAVSGLKMTLAHERKANEMLLNFEITAQMKDTSAMTTDFLQGMGVLSKEMIRLTDNKEFAKIQELFEKALARNEEQTERMELFLDQNQSQFSSISATGDNISDIEIEKLILEQAGSDDISADSIDKELEELSKKLKG